MIKTAFNKNTGDWNIPWSGRISQYDIVFHAPISDPIHRGLALGNGTVGANIWTEKDKIIIAVNRCDLWDDTKLDFISNWKPEEEDLATTLRHACRIVIDFKLPMFDSFYLSEFEAKLSLSDATAHIHSKTPFGEIFFEAYIDKATGLLKINLETNSDDNVNTECYIERFGSRTYSHWYAMLRRDPTIGLTGTKAMLENDSAVISHQLTTGTFYCVFNCKRFISKSVRHSRSAGFIIENGKNTLTLGVSSPTDENGLENTKNLTTDKENHNELWKDFWLRSYVDVGDDYSNALYHSGMYYLCASQGGSYPGRFINGLFGFSRDVQNWNYYFHWNQQELYWSLNAAGHSDLCDSYLNFRFNAMEYSRQDAKNHFHTKGIYVSDVCDRKGRNSQNEFYNRTPVAEVALDFWRQYCFTQDKEFLINKAAPYMIEATEFFTSLFKKEEDGYYHARGGSCYEGERPIDDSITELTYVQALVPKTIKAAELAGIELPEKEKWLDIVKNIVPFKLLKPADDIIEIKDGKPYVNSEFFKGDELPSDKIISAGYVPKVQQYAAQHLPKNYLIFRTSWYSSVFPSGLYGFKDKGTDNYNALVTVLKCFAPAACGWDTSPIAICRLGLKEEARRILLRYPTDWQKYENGFGQYNSRNTATDKEDDADPLVIRNSQDETDSFPTSMKPFRHMGLEPVGVFGATVNEMLLQSTDENEIFIAPALSEKLDSAFTLYARGNFRVSSEIKQGKVLFVHITAESDGTFTLYNPWEKAYSDHKEFGDKKITLTLKKGESIFFTPEKNPEIELCEIDARPNTKYRLHSEGVAKIGLPRNY